MITAPVSGKVRPQALMDPLRSESSRLDPGVRAEFERSLGAPFGDVVVHTGSASAAAAERADAAAFTVGRHIVFGPGAYRPGTARGRMLLAHELAHVEQQRRGGGDLDLGTSRPESVIGRVATGEAAAHAAASSVADGQSTAVSGAAPVGIAREDKKEEEKSWREKLWDKTKEKIREQAKTTLGQIEGVAIEAGQIVDTVVWVPYAAVDATDAVIDAASKKLGVSEKTAAAIKGAVPGGPALKALRKEAAKAGMVDPDTGAPIVSGKITEGFTAAEKALDKHVFTGMKKEEGFFTDREIGQLQGAIGAQIALSFVGVEEVQLALKVVSAVGVVKTIVSAMQRNPKGFITDRAFWTAIANAFLHVAGLKSASSGKKITTLVVDVLSVTLASTNEILQLRQDMALPPGPERDRAIARDIQALIRVVAGAVQQALSHHKSLKAAAAKTTAAGADPIEGPPAVGSTSLKPAPATGTETPEPPTMPTFGPKAPALQASGEAPSTKLRVAVPDADATAPKVRIAHPEDAPPRVRVATEEASPKVRVAEPDTELADAAPEAKRLRAVAAEAAPPAKAETHSTAEAPTVVAPKASAPTSTTASILASPAPGRPAPTSTAPAGRPRVRGLKESQVSAKAARAGLKAAVAQKKLADAAVGDAKGRVDSARAQVATAKDAAAKAASVHGSAPKGSIRAAQKASTKAKGDLAIAQKELTAATTALARARGDARAATAKNAAAKTRFRLRNKELGVALARKAAKPLPKGKRGKRGATSDDPGIPIKDLRSQARALKREANMDPGAVDRLRALYEGQPDSSLRKLKNDPVAASVIEKRRSKNPELDDILASDWRPPHTATVQVVDEAGRPGPKTELTSGGLPADERKSMPWREASQASHTEAKAVAQIPLRPGQTMRITGQYDPCSSCQTRMQAAATKSRATIVYWWPGGPPNGQVFVPEVVR